MSMERVLFSLFSAMAIVSAILFVRFGDPVNAALSLVACYFSLAFLFHGAVEQKNTFASAFLASSCQAARLRFSSPDEFGIDRIQLDMY